MRAAPVRPQVGISRCLLGDTVRYDGGHKREEGLIRDLAGRLEWVAVCPELEVGMGVPREPIQLVAGTGRRSTGGADLRLMGVTSGTDWTAGMERWARERLQTLTGLSGFVLKARSPSCGPAGVVVVHRGGTAAERVTATGRGLFAQVLAEVLPDLPVEDEEALRVPALREMFMARVLACHRRRYPADPHISLPTGPRSS